MILKWKELWQASRKAMAQSVSMQRRLQVYWFSMVLVVFAALMLALSLAGAFSDTARKLSDTLEIQQRNTVSAISEQFSGLNAQCVSLSETLSAVISNTLKEHGGAVRDLNDDPVLITELEESLYEHLRVALQSSDCNGAFVVLDVTVNTALEHADTSRMGLYLRYSDLNSTASARQKLVYYRGVADVARSRSVEMHNRWNLEFDTAFLPGYDQLMAAPPNRLAEAGVWSERTRLKDTWEDVLRLYVPVLDWDGQICGLCGIELSELYFNLSYPAAETDYGSMTTLLAPLEGKQLILSQGMLGGGEGSCLEPQGTLHIKEGAYYNTYSDGKRQYIGVHQPLGCATVNGRQLAVVTLIPEAGYSRQAAASRTLWIAGSLAFLLCTLALSVFLTRQFIRPITRSFERIRQEDGTMDGASSGISEIDELMAFFQSRSGQTLPGEELPPEIRELIDAFTRRAAALTSTERAVLGHYINGSATRDIPELMCISAGTAKAHNRNIYRKLEVSSYDELKAYIDVLQRCGQIDILLAPKID